MNAKDVKAKGSAPGQYLGFALQPVRLFYHLLRCNPGDSVGLEYVDDVSVHTGDSVCIAEQCKSALSQNPISNWAVDFWKTLSNWLDNIEAGYLDAAQTQFQLYVTPVKKSDLSQKLSDAASDDEIRSLIKDIKKRREKMKAAPNCDPYLQKVLGTDTARLVALIRNYRLINTDNCPLAPIESFLSATLKPHIVTAACRFGIGDAKRRIDDATVSVEALVEFSALFHFFVTDSIDKDTVSLGSEEATVEKTIHFDLTVTADRKIDDKPIFHEVEVANRPFDVDFGYVEAFPHDNPEHEKY